MAAIHHIGCLKEAFHTSGTPCFAKFGEDILIIGRDMLPKLILKQSPPMAKFLLPVSILTRLYLWHLNMCDDKKLAK